MKKIYILFAGLFLLAVQLKAQAPNAINYQGVARNTSGLVLPNQGIGLRFTIHQGSAGGTTVYQETQSATTNLLGLFTVAIGSGTPVTGTFAAIAWSGNNEYLQVEMDPTALGGTSYLNMGTSQFLSVPYAMSSGSGWNLTGNSSTGGTDYIGTTDANDVIIKAHNNEVMRIANTTKNVGIGNPTPDASAALDITSSTQGLLMPRMANAPASPSLGLMYFNTTSGCFMFYNGSSWQAVICGCPNPPATPGTITSSTGSGNFCPGAAGVIYSIAPLNNVTSYTWSTPTGATITGGQGSNVVTLTEGTTSSAISVTATNNCSTSAANSLTLTVGAAPAVTSQPASSGVSCLSGGTATFTVAATNASSYQWQVNSGSGFGNVSNGGFYSGATTTTLSVINPTSGMNGYQYKCIVTGACGSTASNAATLTAGQSSVPIVISNSQGTTTSANLAVKLIINFSTFSGNGLHTNLDNLEFTTGPGGSGTPLYAWIESGAAPTAGTSTESAATSSSTTALVWVNMGSTTIPASGSVTIYMNFLSSAVMVASTTGASTGYTGMAPQLTGAALPTYGQYDNGVLVFPSFYDNFAGTTLASKWANPGGASALTINNGIAIAWVSNHNWWAINTSTFSSALNNVADAYMKASDTNGDGACINTNGLDAQLCGPSASGYAFGAGGTVSSNPNANATIANATPLANTFYVLSFTMLNTPVYQLSYGAFSSVTGSGSALNRIAANSPVGLGASQPVTGTYQWFRIRSNPPNNVLPTGAVGTFGCY